MSSSAHHERGSHRFTAEGKSVKAMMMAVLPAAFDHAQDETAVGLRKEGVVDIFFDLSPHETARADSLDEFIEELGARLEGTPTSIRNRGKRSR
jgi:hypothetical protein